MVVTINGITFSDVFSCGYNGCELAMVFNRGHKYSTMEEIETKLNQAGLSVGNFYFKGVSMWNYDHIGEMFNGHVENFNEDEETSLLCMVPQNIRDTFQIDCREEDYPLNDEEYSSTTYTTPEEDWEALYELKANITNK